MRFTSSNRCFHVLVEDQPEFALRCDDLEEDPVSKGDGKLGLLQKTGAMVCHGLSQLIGNKYNFVRFRVPEFFSFSSVEERLHLEKLLEAQSVGSH